MLLGLNYCRYITASSGSPHLVEEESASGFKVATAAAQGLPGCQQHRKSQVIQFCTRLQLNCHPVVRDSFTTRGCPRSGRRHRKLICGNKIHLWAADNSISAVAK